MSKHLLAAAPLLALGCINYSAMAHKDAVAELKCADEQIQVKQTSTSGYPIYFKAEGCGQYATYACWDDVPPARTPQEAQQSNPVCELVGSSMPRSPASTAAERPMSEGESRCRSQCGGAGDSCRAGCSGDYCETMCRELERGCVQGCLNALPPETGAPGESVTTNR